MSAVFPHPRSLAGAVIAGLVAGILLLACEALLDGVLLGLPDFSPGAMFVFAASVLLGRPVPAEPGFVALGAALHFAVAVIWAVSYAVSAERQVQLLARPVLSGAVFGGLVYFCMQVLIITANRYHVPTPPQLAADLIAHIGFFGIPVALIIARTHQPK